LSELADGPQDKARVFNPGKVPGTGDRELLD
jgi:hypothetical protein